MLWGAVKCLPGRNELTRHVRGSKHARTPRLEVLNTDPSIIMMMGSSSACVFRHKTRQIICTVHGDDFITTGPEASIQELDQNIKQNYQTKSSIVGAAKRLDKEAKALNRLITWDEKATVYEPDPRHAENMIKELKVEGAKDVGTPTCREEFDKVRTGDWPALDKHDATRCRGLAARLNYLALDRPDLQVAAKCVAQEMANPSQESWALLKRVGRYLQARH